MKKQDDSGLLVDFFDNQQSTSKYDVLKARTRLIDLQAAEMLNSAAKGSTLSIGGVWDHFQWRDDLKALTVVDMSEKMLDAYAPARSTRIQGDFYQCAFAPGAFDTIIFPLILHHVAEGAASNWASCKARIARAFDLSWTWLKPGGSVFVFEYCPHPAWTPLQSSLLPLTRRFLRAFGQPLVAMHTKDLYLARLRAAKLEPQATPLRADGFNAASWYPLFMATPWLQVPFAVFPKPFVFRGTKSA